MTKAVIFDWGGVLMRTIDRGPRYRWDRKLRLSPGSVESIVHGIEAWHQAQLGEIGVYEYWQAVGSKLGLMPEALSDLRRDFFNGDRLDENLIRFIRSLRGRTKVGLLSNNALDLNDLLTELRLDDLFDACVISAAIGIMKPHPKAYQSILDRLDTLPQNALFVDDSVRNIEGARSVGMQAVHFTPMLDLSSLVEAWLNE